MNMLELSELAGRRRTTTRTWDVVEKGSAKSSASLAMSAFITITDNQYK